MPSGFSDRVAFSGLTNPTSVRFSPDGRVFVAEKGGRLKVFDSLADPTPTVAVDLNTEVDDFWDRGLLGLALDPSFPAAPYVYLLYTYDAPRDQTAPVWHDACPSPPGPTTDGCVVTGKLVRVQLSGDVAVGSPQVLISNQWCQQYPSHSVGDLRFGADGMLYVSGGDGASFNWVDYGQGGGGNNGLPTPKNPCGDPPAGSGGNEVPPTAEGGALRSQSPRRAGGPGLLNGSLLRLDPATGAAAAGNPWAASGDANLRRVIAYGLRNPFRFVFRPGTSQIWIGDVGWETWEEIDRREAPTGAVQNFGWPCYEGAGIQPGYQSAGLNSCSALYATPGSVTGPYYTYSHAAQVAPGDNCPTANGSVVSGLAFYEGGSYPASYDGALVFADHSRNCIWTMGLVGGQPDPSRLQALVEGAANPVDIETGPGGDLYYVDFDGGTIHHIVYSPVPPCPDDTFRAEYFNNMTLGGQPVLTRCENAIDHVWGTGSPAPEVNADSFSARWTRDVDLTPGTYTFTATTDDGIRVYLDGTPLIDEWHEQAPTTYTAENVHVSEGTHHVRVEYYEDGNTAVAQVHWQLAHADAPPVPVIDAPSPSLTYAVADPIAFSGHATDADDGPLPASALSWTLLVHHCTPAGCHVHNVQSWAGTTGGSVDAPDHEYPSHLELVLRATDSFGVTRSSSVTLDPKTVELSFRTQPAGLALAVGSASAAAPFTTTSIVGSQSSMSAPPTQTLGGEVLHFASWSDGGAATHNFTAPASGTTYTATYVGELPPPPSVTSAPTLSGVARQGRTLHATAGTWTGAAGLAYAWLRCDRNGAGCVAVAGAATSSYTPTAFDIGSRLVAQVTATNAGGSSSARSSASAVVERAVRGVVRAVPRRHVRARPHRGR